MSQDKRGQSSPGKVKGYVEASRKGDTIDLPFPNKPTSHKRYSRVMDTIDGSDFEKINISSQQERAWFSHPPSDDFSDHNRSEHLKNDALRQPTVEVQMAQEIQAKELVLQEKLWRVEEKIRQRMHWDHSLNVQHRDQYGHQGGRGEMEQKQSEKSNPQIQRREPTKSKDTTVHETRVEDLRRPSKEKEKCEDDASRRPNKSMWQNVKEYSRGKEGKKIHYSSTTNTQHHQNMNTVKNSDASKTVEIKHEEKTREERDMDDNSASKNHTDRKLLAAEPTPSHSSQSQLEIMENTYIPIQSVPCKICGRKFVKERLEIHVRICNQKKRGPQPVYDSSLYRNKGCQVEEFFKTHSRSRTPEPLRKLYQKRKEKRDQKCLQQGQAAAGTVHGNPCKTMQKK